MVERRQDAPHRPFCCQRCRLIDLNRWFEGEYVVSDPIRPDDLDDESEGDPPPAEA